MEKQKNNILRLYLFRGIIFFLFVVYAILGLLIYLWRIIPMADWAPATLLFLLVCTSILSQSTKRVSKDVPEKHQERSKKIFLIAYIALFVCGALALILTLFA